MSKLIRRAQEHDPDAFAELMRMHDRDMYRMARSILQNDADIADAIQDTILACYEHLPELRNPAYFKTWLLRILINKCNDLLRIGRKTVPIEALSEEGYSGAALENAEFEMLMDSLDETYRTVLVLYYAEGMSVRQISKMLDVTESAVKQRLRRGRDKARELFEPDKTNIRLEVLT